MKKLYATMLVLLIGALSYDAKAIKTTAYASVEIVEPTGFSIESGFGTLSIDRSDSIFKKILGVNKEYSKNLPESEYRISGSNNNAIQISVLSQYTDESKVKIDDFVVSYLNGAGKGDNGIVKPAPGRDAKLKLGATVKVQEDAQSGYYEPDFNIAIYYE